MRKSSISVAVDLGATNVRVALVTSAGKIIAQIHDKTQHAGSRGEIVTNQIIALIERLIHAMSTNAMLAGIGISSMGPLDYKRGGPFHTPNMPFAFIPLTRPLERHFALPVLLFNDCNAAVLGERRFGAGKKKKNLFYLTISTGIGGGAIVDDRLLFGAGGNAGEVGHLGVESAYGFPCACKKGIGHWEGLASGRNMPRFFRYWLKKTNRHTKSVSKDATGIFLAAAAGDQYAKEFLGELATIHARGISDLIVSYNPELITIGGAVALHNKNFFLKEVAGRVDRYLTVPQIKITPLGEAITLLGAASGIFDAKECS